MTRSMTPVYTPKGGVGLLINSIIWHGLKFDEEWRIRQKDEEPIDLFETLYQNLQPLLLQTAARARTYAEYMTNKRRSIGLREIDKEAT